MRALVWSLFVCSVCLQWVCTSTVYAGAFGTAHFIQTKSIGIGVEPELLISDPFSKSLSLGFNLRGAYGLTADSNMHLMIGSTTGEKRFGASIMLTKVILFDTSAQPGLGIAYGGSTHHYSKDSYWSFMLMPYIHKTLSLGFTTIEPFFAYFIASDHNQGAYTIQSRLIAGFQIHHSLSWSSLIELGVSVNNSVTYISGGLVYYY